MKSQAERLVYAFRASRVKRWHTHSYLIYEDTVGHHSHGVAMIILLLHPDPSSSLLKAALLHDLGEKKVGDVSHWVKKDDPQFARMLGLKEDQVLADYGMPNTFYNLDEIDRYWLKAADALHAWMVLRENILCGNESMRRVYTKLSLQITEMVNNKVWPKPILTVMNDMSATTPLWHDS